MSTNPKNYIYYGDNLEVLRKHIEDESVDLCYIDPPFNSKRNYNQIYNNVGHEDRAQAQAFMDTWTWDEAAEKGFEEIVTNYGGVFTKRSIDLIIGFEKVLSKGSLLAYLIHITLRLAEIHRVLKLTGSFYLHCDPTASHYLKILLDGIFVDRGGDFKNEIIWRRTGQHNKILRYAPIHDVIFFYTKSNKYTWNFPKRPFMQRHIDENFIKDSKGYRTNYYGNVLTGSGIRGGESGEIWKGFNPTAKGRHWAIPGALIDDINESFDGLTQHQKLDRLFELGYITITEDQAWPIYARYLNKNDGQALSDLWTFQPYTNGTVFGTDEGIDEDVRWLSTRDKERLGYPTQKPEGLLERIIKASSNVGHTILDAYCGCGTSVAVAERLQRNWIGIDITYHSISLILKRLEDSFGKKVLNNIILSGDPKDMEAASALANRADDKTRKEFEKWAVLTYSNNRAIINEKKGGDKGIDGIIYLFDVDEKGKQITQTGIFSVKSNKTLSPSVVRDLNGTMERDGAVVGFLLTLYPMPNLVKECKKYGTYTPNYTNQVYPRISVIKVQDIIDGARISISTNISKEVVKSSTKRKKEGDQTALEF